MAAQRGGFREAIDRATAVETAKAMATGREAAMAASPPMTGRSSRRARTSVAVRSAITDRMSASTSGGRAPPQLACCAVLTGQRLGMFASTALRRTRGRNVRGGSLGCKSRFGQASAATGHGFSALKRCEISRSNRPHSLPSACCRHGAPRSGLHGSLDCGAYLRDTTSRKLHCMSKPL